MSNTKTTPEQMLARVVRFKDVKQHPIPLMFIDSVLPRHQRLNYSIIGDTASENPDFSPMFNQPHKFQIGMVNAPPKCGPAYHTHEYVEMFLPLTGKWRFYWGNDPDGEPEGEVILSQWDMISFPPHLYRGLENVSRTNSWLFAVLDPHDVYRFKDPIWAQQVLDQAGAHGFRADERGKMIKPDNYGEVHAQLLSKLTKSMKASDAANRTRTMPKPKSAKASKPTKRAGASKTATVARTKHK
jgi:quercetin dioxygenase-like cupin family protein